MGGQMGLGMPMGVGGQMGGRPMPPPPNPNIVWRVMPKKKSLETPECHCLILPPIGANDYI